MTAHPSAVLMDILAAQQSLLQFGLLMLRFHFSGKWLEPWPLPQTVQDIFLNAAPAHSLVPPNKSLNPKP